MLSVHSLKQTAGSGTEVKTAQRRIHRNGFLLAKQDKKKANDSKLCHEHQCEQNKLDGHNYIQACHVVTTFLLRVAFLVQWITLFKTKWIRYFLKHAETAASAPILSTCTVMKA